MCSSTAAAGSICGSATSQARRSALSPSSNSPIQIAQTGNRPKRGREYRPIAQAIAFGQGYRLTTPFARARERDNALSGKLGERDTRPRGRVGRSPGRARRPRKGAARRRRIAETTSRRSRDSSARLPAARCPSRSGRSIRPPIEASSTLTCSITSRELTAAPRQRQPQRCDRHREAPAAGRRGALDVGLGQRQLSSGFLQPALCELNRRVSQRQLRMID